MAKATAPLAVGGFFYKGNDMFKETGKLVHGVNGVTDFEVRLLTTDESITALEQAVANEGGDVSMIRVRKYEIAQVLTIGGHAVDAHTVGAMLATDYETINNALRVLEKKLHAPAVPRMDSSTPENPNTTP